MSRQTTANALYLHQQNVARVTLAAIEQQLEDHARNITGPLNFGHVGDLDHVVGKLGEVLAFLRGEG